MKNLSNENIIHIKHGEIEYIQFKKLLEYKEKIKHCFTLKKLDFKGYESYEENKEMITIKHYAKIWISSMKIYADQNKRIQIM